MRLEVGLEAERDLNEAAAFYEEKAEGLGREFLDEAAHVFGRLRDAPLTGVRMGGEMRRYLLRRFPFSVLYRIREDLIVVVAVMHHRKSPKFWEDRV